MGEIVVRDGLLILKVTSEANPTTSVEIDSVSEDDRWWYTRLDTGERLGRVGGLEQLREVARRIAALLSLQESTLGSGAA
ncbi:hypothetical protein ABZ801_00890 [Actinomadura sp. NPDC047616]|uniref:hypothetical protein n=1 Tax=Actinomadura sp. NPDC047616 TaxID=3155914 RepID=UPI0033C3BA4E